MTDTVVRLLVAAAVMLVAIAVATVVRRRRAVDPPTQPRRDLPVQIDRADFAGEGWVLVVFTSDTCSTCADVVRKAEAARSDLLSVDVASFQARRDLHERYAIDSVPAVLVADARGVVHRTFIGPVTATDLWAAVADARGAG